jgi:hypothetical protein
MGLSLERMFVNASARDAGMSVVTAGISCSEYWKESDGIYSPSLLDHANRDRGAREERLGACPRVLLDVEMRAASIDDSAG